MWERLGKLALLRRRRRGTTTVKLSVTNIRNLLEGVFKCGCAFPTLFFKSLALALFSGAALFLRPEKNLSRRQAQQRFDQPMKGDSSRAD